MTTTCELINTYEVLEHVMGIDGLHPHQLDTIREMRIRLAQHVIQTASLAEGVILDIGCGSGTGAFELAELVTNGQRVIGIDINSHAINNAKEQYVESSNLSFYHGDLTDFLNDHPDLKISAAICISVSMFIPEVSQFYQLIHRSLLEGGIFIDAPFMFRDQEESISERFRRRTYSVCGCNMSMHQLPQLRTLFREAGFSNVECIEHDFDLMKLRVLFDDYPAHYLMRNFLRNVISPPTHFGSISSRYLFSRTLKIFIFFLKNRQKYASGEFVAIKSTLD